MFFGEEGGDRLGHFAAHVGHLQEQQQRRVADAFQIAEGVRQGLGGFLADLQDAEREQEAAQRRFFRRFQGLDQVGGGFLAHALQTGHVLGFEAVEVGHGLDQFLIHQGVHQLVAQAVDVHGAPRREVLDRLALLGAADQAAGAARHHAVVGAQNLAAAHRALGGQVDFPGVLGAPLGDRAHHLGNHVAGAVDHHAVADADVQPADLVDVMQGGVADRDAAHLNRLQLGHRGQRAGAAHLPVHLVEHGDLFRWRVFQCHRPSRFPGPKAQHVLELDRVHFKDHAIDLVGQAVPLLTDIMKIRQTPGGAFCRFHFLGYAESPVLQVAQPGSLPVADTAALDMPYAVTKEDQRTLGSQL